MLSSSMAAAAVQWDSDEWEVVNHNDFVYKRKKRRTLPSSFARAPDPEPNPNPALENNHRLKRRRTALLQVKGKYQTELVLWDQLANTFKAMEDRVKSKLQQKDSSRVQLHGPCDKGSPSSLVSVEKNNGSLVHELLLKAEAQEVIICNFQQLCDEVDAFCDTLEEKAKQDFLNLPIWNSPRELMSPLYED